MQQKKLAISFVVFLALGAFSLSIHYQLGRKMVKVHTLKFPMLLGGPGGNGPYQLLPKGTTLYFDQEYPEGFTRYIVYVNVDRYPLETIDLDDPTSIDPITAYSMDKGDLKRLLDRNPITKEDLTAILKSGQLTRHEIKELLEEYSK